MREGKVAEFVASSELFGSLPAEVREELETRLVPLSVDGGDVVLREGEVADGLYLVVAGRLQATAGDAGEVLGEIGRGEVVGEAALLTDQVRSATVRALRDAELLQLPVEAFEALVAEHPGFLRPITAQVVRRMQAAGRRPEGRPATAIAVVPTHGGPAVTATARALADALTAQVATGAVVADAAEAGDATWAEALEAANDLVVYVGDIEDPAWTRRCLRLVDVVLLLADGDQRPRLTEVEAALDEHRAKVDLPVELVLVHPSHRDAPARTRDWLRERRVRRHHHVRVGDEAHLARVARLVTGRGIGLVLSGGGARGMAEIGVVQAMLELGVPIDAVGGTSAGSLVAGAVARGWPIEEIRRVLRRGMVEGSNPVDLTMPMTSLAAGKRITERLRGAAGEVEIEDLWLDYFCVSTNLSRNAPQIHRSGPGWRAIRASMSIPGIFPPVALDGDVLVDGGLVDNLPVAEMRRGHDGIRVVAVDVGVHRGLAAGDLPDSTVMSGWRLLADRLHPNRASPEVAGLLTILTRLTELGGGSGESVLDAGEVMVRPDVEPFPILDFSNFDALVEVGHRAGLEVLSPWWDEQRGPG